MSYRWFVYPKSIFVLIMAAGIGWHLEAYAASLRLSWTDASNNETGFKIERMASSGSYAQIATVSANVQIYTDTGLNSGTTYCYRVRAFNSTGASSPSNASCTTASTSSSGTSTISVTPAVVKPGGMITVAWQNIPAPKAGDFFRIFDESQRPIMSGTSQIWRRTDCTTGSGSARASGSCTFATPVGIDAPRHYTFRLFAAGSSSATSTPLAISNAMNVDASSVGSSGESTPTSPSGTIARLSSKWSDYRVSMKIRSTDNDAIGVMFRYLDTDNYYRFSWYPQEKFRRLEKRVDGAFKVLAQDTVAYRTGQTYALQIVAQGPSLKVLIDGKTIFSVNDTSLTEGTIALYSFYNVGASFDDVVVEELPSGNLLLSDNFNHHDHRGWTIVDEGNHDGPSKWSAATGALVQSGNLGSAQAGDFGTYALFTRGSWQDYRVTAKMRSVDNDPIGIVFRFQDGENYYRFSWDRETAGRQLIKREQGVVKVIAKDSVPYVAGTNYAVEIIAQGSSLKVNIDGKPVFSAIDQSFKAGTVALFSSHNRGSFFDNLLVEELPTKAVLLWDDFNNGDFAGWIVFDEAGTSWGPSTWSVVKGELVQSSNIGSDATGNLGTFVLY